jgi:hypothetical protein
VSHEETVNLIVRITPADHRCAKGLAARRGTSVTQVFREALRTEAYLQEQLDAGRSVLIKDGKRARRVVFAQMEAPA